MNQILGGPAAPVCGLVSYISAAAFFAGTHHNPAVGSIDAEKVNYPITFMCELLEVPRSFVCAWRGRVESATAVHHRLLPLDAGMSVGSRPRGLATV